MQAARQANSLAGSKAAVAASQFGVRAPEHRFPLCRESGAALRTLPFPDTNLIDKQDFLS